MYCNVCNKFRKSKKSKISYNANIVYFPDDNIDSN